MTEQRCSIYPCRLLCEDGMSVCQDHVALESSVASAYSSFSEIERDRADRIGAEQRSREDGIMGLGS